MKKKNNIPLTEEEINSLMKELKNIEIEDMADRAKIIERSEKLEMQDKADLTALMERGGKVSHKKGGGFTYKMGGKVKTMSEYMKDLMGGREFLENNFQGGGSVRDIMLMNAQMTNMQQPPMMQTRGNVEDDGFETKPKQKDYKDERGRWKPEGFMDYNNALMDWNAIYHPERNNPDNITITTEPSEGSRTAEMIKSIDEKSVTNPPVVTYTDDATINNVETQNDFSFEDLMRTPTIPMEGAPNTPPPRTGPPYTADNPNPNPNSGAEIDDDYVVTLDDVDPNATNVTDPNAIDYNNLGEIDYTVDPDTGEPLTDPRDPRRDPLTAEILDTSELNQPVESTVSTNPLPTYKESVLQEHADMYGVKPEDMEWYDNKQQWFPKDGAESIYGDTWIKDVEGDDPEGPVGAWADDARNYEFDAEGNPIREVPANKTMDRLRGEYENLGRTPSYEEYDLAWQMENPNAPDNQRPSFEDYQALFGTPDPSQLPIDDPLHPDYLKNKYPTVEGGPPNVGEIDRNNNGMPDYLERQAEIPTLPIQEIPSITDPNALQLPELSTADPIDVTTSGGDLQEEAAKRYGFTMDEDENSPTFGEYFKGDDQLMWDDNMEMWVPGSMMNLPPANNVAKPRQTIKELLEGMNIKKNLPDILGGAGSAISGFGPLATTLKAGMDTDEINYFEDIENAAIADQEKALNVFDDGKESARRVIDRQRRQGINRLDDYVMSAGQRRAGARALDVAAMEQMPLSDLRFDTQKSQLYNQIAQTRFQGDIADATGATARDDKLDQNRDNYYSNLSENLSNLGTQTQNFAKQMGQKRQTNYKS